MAEQVKPAIIKIGDTDYNVADLADNAKAQLQGIQVADMEIKRLNMQLALMQTARNAYMQALQTMVPDND